MVVLLVVGCVALAWIATGHERGALSATAERHGQALVRNLAGDAKEPLLAEDDLRLQALVDHAASEKGLVGARLLRSDRVVASLQAGEQGTTRRPLTEGNGEQVAVVRAGQRLVLASPVVFSGTRVGEAQIELDLDILVEQVVNESRRQLTFAAVGIVALGVGGGLAFVALLVGPIRRLRSGVDRLAQGDLTARVPPTSRDEVGELTRAFNEMGESLQQKERIQHAFGRYVSDYVLNQLLEDADGGELGGSEREVTILFADVRRFTRLSEGMKASDVVSLLNEVFQLVSDRILAQGGTIDKFIGDSVMAYFGAPVPQGDHALRAVRAAVDIQEAMKTRNAAAGTTPVEIGIGIHTGMVVVGTIGSDRRTDFTAIGDAVNVAHRLEKLAAPGGILVSEAVQRRARGSCRLRFEGERQLSGRQEPVHVYAVDASAAPGGAEPAMAVGSS